MHIHDLHTDKADECQVCIVVKNFQSADVGSLTIEVASLDFYFTALVPNPYEVIVNLDKGYYSTAPPRYSFI
jgi:hypothetical protein